MFGDAQISLWRDAYSKEKTKRLRQLRGKNDRIHQQCYRHINRLQDQIDKAKKEQKEIVAKNKIIDSILSDRPKTPQKEKSTKLFVVSCDYCGEPAECVMGSDVYPHRPDLAKKVLWECKPCEARVGCHPETTKPLGRLANEQLRILKMQAHGAFDPIWKTGKMKRAKAYAWLAGELEIDGSDCHIGMMDEMMCEKVVEVCREYHRSNAA